MNVRNYVAGVQMFLRRLPKRVRKNPALYAAGLLLAGGVLAYMIGSMNRQLAVDPVTCRPLLDLIAQAESKGNYNAYFGNASNTEVKFTEMSVAEVLDWQKAFVAQGNPSSAVGRYQIINTTLVGLVQELDLQGSEVFDEAMQDRLALALLERRGVVAYINGRIDAKQFAAELAKEWAGLPRILGDAPEKSYYAGDGLNTALVGADEVLRVVGVIAAR